MILSLEVIVNDLSPKRSITDQKKRENNEIFLLEMKKSDHLICWRNFTYELVPTIYFIAI